MPDVDRFLADLESELGKRLSPLDARTLVAEARDHLVTSIQARLELGSSQEEAEKEAIAAFGAARTVGEEARRRVPWIDRRFLLTSLAVLAYWGTCQGSFPDWLLIPVIVGFFCVHGLFIVNSARTRRFQGATLAVVLLSLWLAWSARGALDHVWTDDVWGSNRMVRADAPRSARSIREAGDARVRGAYLLREGYVRFRRGEISASPARNATLDDHGVPRLFPRTDRALAEANWRNALKRISVASALVTRASFHGDAANIDAAWRGPWWHGLRHEAAYIFAASGWAVGSVYVALHAWGWAFGWALRRKRRGGGRIAA